MAGARVVPLLCGLVLLVVRVHAFWRLPCAAPISIERADPIVTPGALSGHSHTIMGASAFSASSTPASIRNSKCSTCTVKEDMSNYWIQTLFYQHPNGTMQSVDQNGGMLVYYLQRSGSRTTNITAFPEGMRMVAGYPGKHYYDGSRAARAITYACLCYTCPAAPETHAFPQRNCPNGLRVQVFFPSCWNGRDVDSPDHRSHMAYPDGVDSGNCPDDYPIRTISIFFEVIYKTDVFASGWLDAAGKPYRAMPFFWSTGDNTGYGHHGDFMNGWNTAVLQRAVDRCTASSGVVEDCPEFTFWTSAAAQNCKHEFLPASTQVLEGLLDALPGLAPISVASFNPCGQSPTVGNDSTTRGALGTCTTGFTGYDAYTSPTSTEDNVHDGTTARVVAAPNPIVQEGYLGCYVDSTNGVRTFTRQLGTGYLVPTCRAAAARAGWQYFALQFYGECWVTNSSTSWSSQGTSEECYGSCTADPLYYCGLGKVNQVYSTFNLSLPVDSSAGTPYHTGTSYSTTSSTGTNLNAASSSYRRPSLPMAIVMLALALATAAFI